MIDIQPLSKYSDRFGLSTARKCEIGMSFVDSYIVAKYRFYKMLFVFVSDPNTNVGVNLSVRHLLNMI